MATRREFREDVRKAIGDHKASMPLHKILSIADREDFMLALEDYFFRPELIGQGWGAVLRLSPEARLVLSLNCLASALFSSGVAKFLMESRELFGEALAGSEAIGAVVATSLLLDVRASFPNGSLPPSSEECGELILDPATNLESKIRQLERAHDGAYEQVIDKLREYIKNDIDRFVVRPDTSGH